MKTKITKQNLIQKKNPKPIKALTFKFHSSSCVGARNLKPKTKQKQPKKPHPQQQPLYNFVISKTIHKVES